jgi:predicted Fe-Mo cluster-binding NifX family protein
MRIAISAAGPTLDAEVDPRFGRCRYFIIADPDTLEFESFENSSQTASGGAGVASAQLVAGKDVTAVLTGNCGPNAYHTLEAAGIEVITDVSGTVRDAIQGYKEGRFKATSGPTVGAHHGMGGGRGAVGFGVRRTGAAGERSGNVEEDLEALKAQTADIGRQLGDIARRLESIEKARGA